MILLFIFSWQSVFSAPPIVFVHVGPAIPEYARDAIDQARLFNPESDVFLLASKNALETFSHPSITPVPLESLSASGLHRRFNQNYRHKHTLFHYAIERFYYLHEAMEQLGLTEVFHLEYDVMLYVNLGDLLPIFRSHYPKMGATFDSDSRCIPGFVYIADAASLKAMLLYTTKAAWKGTYDMQLIAQYKKVTDGSGVAPLPVIHQAYIDHNTLIARNGLTASCPGELCSHIDLFDSIFDAAALGQYLGGTDPKNSPYKPGFVNESSVYQPDKLDFVWEWDEHMRKVPYALYKGEKRRINNLHIHCKNLKKFSS